VTTKQNKENFDLEKGKKRHLRIILSSNDIKQALSFVEKLREEPTDKVIRQALETAAVVSYARPFSGNFGTEQVAERPLLFNENDIPEHLFNLHEEIKRLRNTAYAHTCANSNELFIEWNSENIPLGHFKILTYELNICLNSFENLCRAVLKLATKAELEFQAVRSKV